MIVFYPLPSLPPPHLTSPASCPQSVKMTSPKSSLPFEYYHLPVRMERDSKEATLSSLSSFFYHHLLPPPTPPTSLSPRSVLPAQATPLLRPHAGPDPPWRPREQHTIPSKREERERERDINHSFTLLSHSFILLRLLSTFRPLQIHMNVNTSCTLLCRGDRFIAKSYTPAQIGRFDRFVRSHYIAHW